MKKYICQGCKQIVRLYGFGFHRDNNQLCFDAIFIEAECQESGHGLHDWIYGITFKNCRSCGHVEMMS